jgi:hypothetical protein
MTGYFRVTFGYGLELKLAALCYTQNQRYCHGLLVTR